MISTSVATEVSVYWSLTRKNITKIFVGYFFLISSVEHSFLNRKHKTICCPKGGRTKMEMKSHCDILLYSSLSICNHQEWGNWHYSWFKNTEENYKAVSQLSSKTHSSFLTQTPHISTMFCKETAQIQKDRTVTGGRTCTFPPICNPNPSSHNSLEWDFVTICSVLLVRPLTQRSWSGFH